MNPYSIRRILSMVFVLSAAMTLSLSAQNKVMLRGKIFDALTSHELRKGTVRVLDASGNVVDSTKVRTFDIIDHWDGSEPVFVEESSYFLNKPLPEGKYIIEAESQGFEITRLAYTLADLGSRESDRDIPNIYLKRISNVKELGEVVVKASKVKFYNKGDTIVYNADAFDLPEGSMLDALVKQLPGVEIREGGRIYVNGRYVESLLLNGRDFFKGNKQVMLDNLGAYMVKTVNVYEKLSKVGELMGKKAGDEEYVMDVRLKKDYMAGNLINVEAGAGTHGRWLGKLFGMHYTNNTRLTVYGNVNNINDTDKPADRGRNWYREPEQGLSRIYRGGVDYFADNARKTWTVSGNADFSMRDRTADTDTYRTSFLSGGNTYDYSFMRPKAKNLTFSTTHSLELKKEKWTLDVRPSFSYNHDKNKDKSVYASFSREIDGVNMKGIEDMFAGKTPGLMENSFINRQINDSKTKGHGFNAGFFSEFLFKIPKTSDVTSVWFETNYNDYRSDRDNLQDIRYADIMLSDMIRKQIFHSVPNRSFTVNPGMKYYFSIKNGTTGFLYNFRHETRKKSTDLFLIDARMDGGSLVFEDADAIFDASNSFTSRQTDDIHLIRPFYTQRFATGIGNFFFKVSPEFGFYHRRLDYHRGEIHATPMKSDFNVRIMDTFLSWFPENNRWDVNIRYNRTPQLAQLVDMVDSRDTSDPLNIQEGNPDLKNSVTNSLSTYIVYTRGAYQSLSFDYNWNENDIVRGYRYDSATGVRTFKAYNVSGNHSLEASYDINGSCNLGKGKFFFLSHTAYQNSVYADMIGYDREPERQRVTNNGISETIHLDFSKGWFSFGPGGSLSYRHTGSELADFRSFKAWDFSYGLHGTMTAPFGLDFTTDITMHSRRGYSQSSMNDNRLLWNARAAYKLMNGKVLLILHARDILGKEKSLSYSVNGQGRTETHYQILPRYVMLTVQCRLDFKPKRLKAGNN